MLGTEVEMERGRCHRARSLVDAIRGKLLSMNWAGVAPQEASRASTDTIATWPELSIQGS